MTPGWTLQLTYTRLQLTYTLTPPIKHAAVIPRIVVSPHCPDTTPSPLPPIPFNPSPCGHKELTARSTGLCRPLSIALANPLTAKWGSGALFAP